MTGVYLPGNSTVEFRDVPVPSPGQGQVLLKMKASSICGSDIRAIYREHLGTGPEAYQGVIAGHEPAGQVEAIGPGCKRLQEGDRVCVYHISGCGLCRDCREGYMISCSSRHRAAYGWQRDGGHAEYMLAEENTCLPLPESLSYVDGALCACGFGTAYEALTRIGVCGSDTVLITGLGPVGLAAAMLARGLGARRIIGTDAQPSRVRLARDRNLVDHAMDAGEAVLEAVGDLTDGLGCEATVDCSGSAAARRTALQLTRQWGRCAFVGEGGDVQFDVSPLLIHKQVTLYGSWVTSLKHLQDLLENLDRWGLRPEDTCTHHLPLSDAAEAYRLADAGECGKVCIVM
ncbi:MAG: zinc-dependent alcohol dehydrogenase family protein [Phycisphaerae bacterium]